MYKEIEYLNNITHNTEVTDVLVYRTKHPDIPSTQASMTH